MLDVSRHFFNASEVKHLLHTMATWMAIFFGELFFLICFFLLLFCLCPFCFRFCFCCCFWSCLVLPCFLACVLHWSFFLFLHLFRSSSCLVASCEFLAAFVACVVIFFLTFSVINERGHKKPLCPWTQDTKGFMKDDQIILRTYEPKPFMSPRPPKM